MPRIRLPAVQRTVAEQWRSATGCSIAEGYGLSETSPTLTCNTATTAEFNGSIGIPVPSTYISIRDDDGNEVPLGEPFALLPTMQSLTLQVIMRAVFGYEPGPESDELRSRLRAMVEPLSRPRGLPLMMLLGRLVGLREG